MVQGAVGAGGRVDRALGVVARRQVTSSSSRGTVSPPRLGEARFYHCRGLPWRLPAVPRRITWWPQVTPAGTLIS